MTIVQDWPRLAASIEPRTQLFIDGRFGPALDGRSRTLIDPATGEETWAVSEGGFGGRRARRTGGEADLRRGRLVRRRAGGAQAGAARPRGSARGEDRGDGVPDHEGDGQADRLLGARGRVHAARAALLRRGHRQGLRRGRPGGPAHARTDHPRADRGRWRDRAMELPASDRDVEDRAGARHGELGRRQTGRAFPAVDDDGRRACGGGGRARRGAQRGRRRGFGRREGARATSPGRPDRVHGLGGGRPRATPKRRRLEPQAGVLGVRRQVPRDHLRRCPEPRARRRDRGRWRVHERRADVQRRFEDPRPGRSPRRVPRASREDDERKVAAGRPACGRHVDGAGGGCDPARRGFCPTSRRASAKGPRRSSAGNRSRRTERATTSHRPCSPASATRCGSPARRSSDRSRP